MTRGANEILTDIIQALGENPNSFALNLGLNRAQAVYDILNGKTKRISTNFIDKILTAYPYVERHFLLTGDGSPLKKGDGILNSPPSNDNFYKSKPVLEAIPLRLADPYGFEATGEKIYQLPDNSLIMQVPVIPYKAWLSYPRGHADPEFYDGLETMPVPIDAVHKGTYLIFEVGGESMLNPGSRKCIWPGEKLIARDLSRDKWKYKLHLNKVDVWVVVHKTGIVVKEITAHDVDSGKITLHSWNPDKTEHPDYDVSLEDVEQIFNVVDPFNRFG